MPDSDYPRCRTCKHWMEGKNLNGGHACGSEKFTGGYGLTHAGAPNQKLQIASDEVILECDEGWEFQPGPDFGCVHHEPR